MEQRDEGKEQAQGARKEEESEAREGMQEGRKSAQIREQASEVAEEWKSVNKLAAFRLGYPGKDICTFQREVGAAVGALLCTSRCLGICLTCQPLLESSSSPSPHKSQDGLFWVSRKKLSHSHTQKIHNLA